MHGRWIAMLAGLWLALFFPTSASPGEKEMNLDDYKKLERRELIARAIERVRKERPEFDPSCFDRVTIEKTPIYVQVTMETPFPFYSLAGREGHDSFQVIVYFLEDAVNAWIPEKLFMPTDVYRRFIALVGGSVAPEGDGMSVQETRKGYEVIFSRDDGSAEGYSMDPKTGEMTMIWHEHPDRDDMPEIVEEGKKETGDD